MPRVMGLQTRKEMALCADTANKSPVLLPQPLITKVTVPTFAYRICHLPTPQAVSDSHKKGVPRAGRP